MGRQESESSPVGKASFSVLIVDDEPGIRDFLERALRKKYAVVDVASDSSSADTLRESRLYDLLIVDINMPGLSGLEWVSQFNSELPSEVIFMTGFAELDNAVAAVRIGASDFILKPFRLEQMTGAVERCYQRLKLSRENHALQHRLARQNGDSALIGDSPAMQSVNTLISRVAATPASILVEGETGTGKELVAGELHRQSGRSGAFVPVNCAAVAPELVESELFGHVPGAFTGAAQARQGLFDYADGGTLFLDEISEMPLALQGKLLRVLEEGTLRPLGTEREKSVDVRVVAASNKPLEALVEQKLFRADLYYRLNILPIQLPPLRDRPEDIGLLSLFFSHQLAEELGLPAVILSPEALLQLQGYHWPGNVRELRNLLERAILLGCPPAELLNMAGATESVGYPVNWSLEQVQVRHIEQVLHSCDGNKSRAARQLGITRKTLDRKRRDLSVPEDSDHSDVDLIPGL